MFFKVALNFCCCLVYPLKYDNVGSGGSDTSPPTPPHSFPPPVSIPPSPHLQGAPSTPSTTDTVVSKEIQTVALRSKFERGREQANKSGKMLPQEGGGDQCAATADAGLVVDGAGPLEDGAVDTEHVPRLQDRERVSEDDSGIGCGTSLEILSGLGASSGPDTPLGDVKGPESPLGDREDSAMPLGDHCPASAPGSTRATVSTQSGPIS